MRSLVLIEHNNHCINANTYSVLTVALLLKVELVCLVVGFQCEAVACEVAKLKGVNSVLYADNPCYEHLLAENIGDLMVSLAQPYRFLIAPSSTFGKNIMPRVAAKLGITQISDICCVVSADTFEHPIYAGNALETVQVLDEKVALTVRATAFDPVTVSEQSSKIQKIDEVIEALSTRFVRRQEAKESVRPDLNHAKIVVSGGRGLENAENFKLIEELAEVLGAAMGASRAAVDAGFIANEAQVGQTGKVVAPDLYIAIGISGAVQHLAGMKDSKKIVAINKDAEAPIFQIADYGLVGDLFELVPQLIDQLKEKK